MNVLNGLEPARVFGFFEEICGIPHGSGNTKQLSDWLVAFAKERGLACIQDEMNNVIIFKEAAAGYETADPVILQGHMDMVCNQEDDCSKDMTTEGLALAVDGDTICAEGTTLGGDDGIAVAYMLALLDDGSLRHPRLECIFTTEEETGLYGAEAIDCAPLTGRRFINLDSEDEGILTVGCAGGLDGIVRIPVSREPYEGQRFEVRLSGLIGGHSGTDIIKGQENAIRALGRVLFELKDQAGARLVSIEGGVADNVIPTSARAVLVSPEMDKAREVADHYRKVFRHEFKMDPDMKLDLTETADAAGGEQAAAPVLLPMDPASGRRVIAFLIGAPNGIEKMTVGIDGLPQTSLSLGLVRTFDGTDVRGSDTAGSDAKAEAPGAACAADAAAGFVEYTFCIRSSVDSEARMLARRLESLAVVMEGSLRQEAVYPGWEYAADSPLRDLVCRVYKEQTGRDMVIEAIHAGLECGYFAGKIPGLDCVSIGPDLRDVHTPNETMSISSVRRTWDLLTEVLARMQ